MPYSYSTNEFQLHVEIILMLLLTEIGSVIIGSLLQFIGLAKNLFSANGLALY